MRIATWNVNSVKQRLPRLLPWLDERKPGRRLPAGDQARRRGVRRAARSELADRGYEVATHGEAAWNGVAILSRAGLEDVVRGSRRPGFPQPEARAVSATCGGIRVVSVYVPNGRSPGSSTTPTSSSGSAALREMVAADAERALVCGDMNIAPADEDVFDPEAYEGHTHVTAPERAALAELQALGLRDVVRDRWPGERVFSYWDYRAGMFHQDLGMRIDLILAGEPVAERVQAAWIDRQARKGKGLSDHAPVIVDLDEAPGRGHRPRRPAAVGAGHEARRQEAAADALMPDAVIFDLDGVLLDSEQRWNEAKEALVREAGGRWRDEAPEVMMGMSSPEWSAYLRDDLSVPLDVRTRSTARSCAGWRTATATGCRCCPEPARPSGRSRPAGRSGSRPPPTAS